MTAQRNAQAQTAKHTPGPWIVCEVEGDDSILNIEQDRHALVDEEPSIIGTVDMAGDGIDPKIGRANAHLIAAAPDLLEVLERVIAEATNPRGDGGVRWGTVDRARAVIARARGQA